MQKKEQNMILDALRDFAISVSLCVLIPLTLMYGISVFLPRPQFVSSEEYQRVETEYSVLREKRDQMVYDRDMVAGKKLEEFKNQQKNQQLEELEKQLKDKDDERDAIKKPLNMQFEEAQKAHARAILFISALLGILFLLSGLFFPVAAIGAGFLFGGTGCIVFGYMHHYHYLSEKVHFFALIIAICLVVSVGYLFFKHRQTNV
jgi:hypothetical protein